MTFVELEYLGIHLMEPENDAYALFRWTEHNRYLPVWMDLDEALAIDSRQTGLEPRRPMTHDVLVDMLARLSDGVEEFRITSFYEGVFIASIVMRGGEEFDVRPSDALTLAQLMDQPITCDADVLAQASVFIADADVEAYLGIKPIQGLLEEEPSDEADDEFTTLMANMGVKEEDLLDSEDFSEDGWSKLNLDELAGDDDSDEGHTPEEK